MIGAYVLARVPAHHSGNFVSNISNPSNGIDAIRADVLWGDYDVIARINGVNSEHILQAVKKSNQPGITGAMLLECTSEIEFIRQASLQRKQTDRTVYIMVVAKEGAKDSIKDFCQKTSSIYIDRSFQVFYGGHFGNSIPLPSLDKVHDGVTLKYPTYYYVIEATYSTPDALEAAVMDELQTTKGVSVTRTYQGVSNIKNCKAWHMSEHEYNYLKFKRPI